MYVAQSVGKWLMENAGFSYEISHKGSPTDNHRLIMKNVEKLEKVQHKLDAESVHLQKKSFAYPATHHKFYFEVKHSQLPVCVVLFQVSGIIYANFEQLQQSTNNQNKQNGVLVQYPLCNFANQSGIQSFP